jgi:hypothetical protein
VVQLQWAYSNKRQSAYATANPDGDINQSHPFEGADIADVVPNMSDNAAMFGKGHEFATRNEILSWDVRFKRSFVATTKMLGWAFAFHTGTDSYTALGGSPPAYQHVMAYQDPTGTGYYGSGRQLPVSTIVEKVTSGMVRKFPSCLVQAVEVTGTLGDWVKLSMDLIGSGKKTDVTPVSGFTFPQSVEGNLLRHASLTFTHGVSGATADVSCSVRSFRFRSELQLFEQDGYCPGSGYQSTGDPTSGQVRNKLEFGRRAVVLEFVVSADATTTLDARLLASTLTTAQLVIEGATISGANKHKLTIDIPQLKYRAVQIGTDGDQIVFAVSTVVFYDAGLANPFRVTVINDVTPAYLVSS